MAMEDIDLEDYAYAMGHIPDPKNTIDLSKVRNNPIRTYLKNN